EVGHVGIYHLLNNGFYDEGAPNFLKQQTKFPQTRRLLSCDFALQPKLRSLDADGSDRSYYRVRQGKISRIIMMYGQEKEENTLFPGIAGFLQKTGINVAHIYHSDKKHRLVTMEDLGDISLWKMIQEISDKDQIINIYKRVLDMMVQLHTKGYRMYCKKPLKISPPFSRKLYLWETEYFKQYFLNRHMKIHWTKRLEKQFKNVTEFLAQDLSKEKHVLIHRDFQSKNIMMKNNKPYMIDFQGMRLGLAQYDLASLLYDPYVSSTESMRRHLLDYYISITKEHYRPIDHEHFIEIFQKATVQRLMQALGAYAFLGYMKGKTDFLNYIPAGVKRLKNALSRLDIQADFLY
ncbi:MAG: phosphotransferase, partial [Chlamydiota bacterium]|nr:phosphotransferase [Chlamydiota bacterium]